MSNWPSDNHVERMVLGTMMIKPSLIPDMNLVPDHFHGRYEKRVFSTISKMHEAGELIDALTIKNKDAELEPIKLMEMVSEAGSVMYADRHVEILEDKRKRRQLIQLACEVKDAALDEDDVSLALERAEKMLVDERPDKRCYTIQEAVDKSIDQAQQIEDGRRYGLKTGMGAVDKGLGGLHNQDVVIVAGRPGMGKTAWAIQAAKGAKTKVLFFSLEMSAEQVGSRMLCSEAGVPGHLVRSGELSPDQWEQLVQAQPRLEGLNIKIYDQPIQTVGDIRATARKESKGLGLIIIDYIQLITSTNKENRNQAVSEISRGIKALAKEMDVPVIALSQLSRQSEKDKKRPQLQDLRDSGAIEQDADIVAFLYREGYYDKDTVGDQAAEFIVAKHRHGPTGTRKFIFQPGTADFRDVILSGGFIS